MHVFKKNLFIHFYYHLLLTIISPQDWQRFKQLESERREEAELERLAMAKKLSLSCRTEREEAEEREREQQLELEMEDLLEDDFMQVYMQKRMQEMMNITRSDKL